MSILYYLAVALTMANTNAVGEHCKFVDLLLSKDWKARQEAYWFWKSDANITLRFTCKEIIFHVIERNQHMTTKSTVNGPEEQYSQKWIAFAILSEWDLPESIPILIRYIGTAIPPIRDSNSIDRGMHETNTAMLGLLALGEQVAQPIVSELAQMDYGLHLSQSSNEYHILRKRLHNLVVVLYRVVGYSKARKMILDEMNKNQFRDPYAYNNLKRVYSLLDDYRMILKP